MSDHADLPKLSTVLFERAGDTLLVILNRPEKLNAVNRTLHNELLPAIRAARDDAESSVIVITGAGRGFCAGGDVEGQAASPTGTNGNRGPHDVYTHAQELVHTILAIDKPTISMINGPAVGLGASIALLCDISVMADIAKIGDTHINVGLVPGDGGAVLWPLLMGPGRAKEMLMTGRLLDGAQAERLGLVNHCVPSSDLRRFTLALADELASKPKFAIRATKHAVNRHVLAAVNNVMEVGLFLEYMSLGRQEHFDAARAFAESRRARRSEAGRAE